MAYKKAFVADFDGTLYFPDREIKIDPKEIEAIRKFQEKGFPFGICSGRTFKEIKRLTDNKIHFDFAVTSSGACVYGIDDSFEVHNEINRNKAEDILEYVERHYGLEGNLHIAESRQISDVTFHPETEEEAENLARDLQGRYYSFIDAIPSNRSVNVIPLGSAKRFAIRELKLHYDVEKMYSVADSVSSYSLFQGCDFNYAVKWGQDEMIEYADSTVGSVAEALEKAAED